MTDKEYKELYIKLDDYVRHNVDAHRYEHTLGVVRAAEKYALKYGADIEKARIAAIFHDACKNTARGLDHGEAAAKLLHQKFGVNDEDILDAIANHTIGRPGMCLLEKVIKLADLLEDGRKYEDVPEIREYDEQVCDINKTYLRLLERQRKFLVQRGIDYDKRTDELIDYMKEVIRNNDK